MGRLLTVFNTGGFSPLDYSPLGLWLDAKNAASVVQTDDVDQWTDQSGNANNVTGTTTARPTYSATGLNSLPAIDFDSNDFMVKTDTATLHGDNVTVFVVCQRETDSGAQQNITGQFPAANREWLIFVNSSDKFAASVSADGSAAVTATTNDTATTGTAFLVEMWTDGTNLNIKVNNGTAATAGFTSAINTGTSNMFVGQGGSGGGFFQGKISEEILYTATLTSDQRTAVRNYLAAKWGITLS